MNTTALPPSVDPLLKQAFLLLEGRGMILNLAREISTWIISEGADGRVVGGIAVVLHGYPRTTVDVDIHTRDTQRMAGLLTRHGCTLDSVRREFHLQGIPIHLVTDEQSGPLQHPDRDIDGVRVVELGDLISMKLRSGTQHVRRAQDMADVVELIVRNGLSKMFASQLAKDQRPAFRKLVASIELDREA